MMENWFGRAALWCTNAIGSAPVFFVALVAVVTWLIVGFPMHFNVAWNFWGNSSTTVVTFLVVFIIQRTVNHDSKALHLKLDEILRSMEGARTSFADLERRSDQRLRDLEQEMLDDAKKASSSEGLDKKADL